MKYHKETQQFYLGIREAMAPADAIVLSDEQSEFIMTNLACGKILRVENDQFVFYDPSNPPLDQVLDTIRAIRAGLLARSDWTQIPDSPLSTEQRAAWATYRQALRDFPSTCTDPRTPQWPTPPA